MITISDKRQYDLAMAQIETFLQKGFANLSEQEEIQLDELSKAVELWEQKEYPVSGEEEKI